MRININMYYYNNNINKMKPPPLDTHYQFVISLMTIYIIYKNNIQWLSKTNFISLVPPHMLSLWSAIIW